MGRMEENRGRGILRSGKRSVCPPIFLSDFPLRFSSVPDFPRLSPIFLSPIFLIGSVQSGHDSLSLFVSHLAFLNLGNSPEELLSLTGDEAQNPARFPF